MTQPPFDPVAVDVSADARPRLAEIALRRRNLLYVVPGSSSPDQVHTCLYELALLGYRVEDEDVDALAAVDPQSLPDVVAAAKEITGLSKAKKTTLHPDFRATVPGMSDDELMLSAVLHYVYGSAGYQWLPPRPPAEVMQREPLQVRTLRPVRTGNGADITSISEALVASSQPYSDVDAADVRTLSPFVPAAVDVPIRENLAFLAAIRAGGHDWTPFLKTPTDVLRLASELSGGSRSLGENTRFRLRRADRPRVMAALEDVLQRGEWTEHLHDVQRNIERWKRLFRALHPQEYRWAERTNAMRDLVHGSGIDIGPAREHRIEQLVAAGDIDALLPLLAENPGDFARRLHALVRHLPQHRNAIVQAFRAIAPQVAPRVLVQMWNFFNSERMQTMPYRVVLPRRAGSGTSFILNTLSLDEDYSDIVAAVEYGLSGRLAGRSFFFDEPFPSASQRLAIPLGLRSASSGTRTAGRGSRIALGDNRYMRFFLHWRNKPERSVDLDLTAFFASEDGKKERHISYTYLRDEETGAFHSGDLTSAPNGAAEYIQLDIEATKAAGYRYLVLLCYAYSGGPFDTVPEAQIGVMTNRTISAGEDFEASEVIARIDLTAKSNYATVAVIDLERRELVWVDWNTKVHVNAPINTETTRTETQVLLDNVRGNATMSIATYIRLAGGTLLSEPADPSHTLDPFHTEEVLKLLS